MTDTNRATSIEQWTSVQAYVLAVICLLVGIAGGWFIRGSQTPTAATAAAEMPTAAPAASAMGTSGAPAPTPAEMQKMADTQAGPLIEKLKADPNNESLLESVGNVYYDAQLYPAAIDYYKRALKFASFISSMSFLLVAPSLPPSRR